MREVLRILWLGLTRPLPPIIRRSTPGETPTGGEKD